MRLVVARCTVNYVGRLEASLPEATRLIMVKMYLSMNHLSWSQAS